MSKAVEFLCRSILFFFALTLALPVRANDSAASTAQGGLQLTREERVSMQKERLAISEKKVRVEYEFLNETDEQITTDVAFPIPDYSFQVDDAGGARGFDDFRVWVEGAELKYQIDVKAICRGVDRSDVLRGLGVDILSFGHFDSDAMVSRDIAKLSPQQRSELLRAGLIDRENKFPQWTVRKIYHWKQTFPARQVLHVTHEYKPVVGFTPVNLNDLDTHVRSKRIADAQQKRKRDAKAMAGWYTRLAGEIDRACIDSSLQKRVEAEARKKNKTADISEKDNIYVEMLWLDYILTTANSWKTPIQDFELVIQRPDFDPERRWYVSLCWDGPIEYPDPDHFLIRVKNFIPKDELRVSFIGI